MVRYIDSGGTILFQLDSCYERRGLLACHRDISASVMRQSSKTISCAQNGWYLPLGGQTNAKNLKEAVGLAYEGLDSNITRAYRCVALLDHNVATGTAHVLRCQETPTAKPVYYIFEGSRFPTQEDRFQFTGEYLQNERRKFEGLSYVSIVRSAPWVARALALLESHVLSPAAVGEEAREAHVAIRSEHDDEMRDARQSAVNRFTEARSPGESDNAAIPSAPEHSVCSAETQAFQDHGQTARQSTLVQSMVPELVYLLGEDASCMGDGRPVLSMPRAI
ncbi:hypothetical protein CYMTET_51100 [Cymbomonas tetramitiformis]|uniref:Uncharacterized protein n=1 Tax=Cymbomonas tetramitiformis TaxID=36881 RepID=A0AAE0BLT1_9CHLO|nr:hypothetical protein CYMTET_51100 [Cymbomonas tetramitiformis]